jgi:hypothetical protein
MGVPRKSGAAIERNLSVSRALGIYWKPARMGTGVEVEEETKAAASKSLPLKIKKTK